MTTYAAGFFRPLPTEYVRRVFQYVDYYYGDYDGNISRREARFGEDLFNYYRYTDVANMFGRLADSLPFFGRERDWDRDGMISWIRSYDELGALARFGGNRHWVEHRDFDPEVIAFNE